MTQYTVGIQQMAFSFLIPKFDFMAHPKSAYCPPVPSMPGHFPSAFLPDFLGSSREMRSWLLPALAQHTS